MAKEIKWERLTLKEAETLAELEKNGIEVFAAPIEIEDNADSRKRQFASLGISWADCKTWHIASKKVLVHLIPADKETYDMLLNDLRTKHREEYRKRRCQIPGKLKPVITCPECNKCSECPYPEYRDRHKATNLSWEVLIESGYEEVSQDSDFHQLEVMSELESVCKVIKAKNPKYLAAIVLKEYYELSVDEIAKRMHDTRRNVYFYLSEARKIGAEYKKNNE